MTMQRDDWNAKYDASGEPVAPQLPSIGQNYNAVIKAEVPSPDVQRAFADDAAGLPATPAVSAKVERDAKGNVVRPDWGPRSEQGQFISKSESDLRQQWAKEGGFEANAARVQAVEAKIVSLSENPEALQSHIATLPDAIQLKAADYLRISTYGIQAAAIKFEGFLNSLSESEFETFHIWWRGLSRSDQDCILAAISRP